MYDSEPVSNLIEEICCEVDNYIEYLNTCDDSESDEEQAFGKGDAIMVYERDSKLFFKTEHFYHYLHLNIGEVALSTLDKLITNGDHDYNKIWELVNSIAEHDIPHEIVVRAEELSKEHYYSNYTIELHHEGSDDSLFYLCELLDDGTSYIIKKHNKYIKDYKNICPVAHSFVPNQVLDFLYPDPNEYTRIRYMGMNKEECIFYPCHEDTILADGYLVVVNVLVGYNENTKTCHLITGERANRLYCKLDRELNK